MYAIGVIIFAFGLLASIGLHEVGHMVPAKRFGVKVTQYMIGFGPTLWSRKKGDTEYGLKALPLGGYIRMIGMIPPAPEGAKSRWPTRIASSVEEFRKASRSEIVTEEDEPRQFYRLTPGKKMIVMLGGPTMNLIIYLILTAVLFSFVGQNTLHITTQIQSINKCVEKQGSAAALQGTCPATLSEAEISPAYKAGIQPGDVIESVNGVPAKNWSDVVKVIQASPGKLIEFGIKRNGVLLTLPITPVLNLNYVNGNSNKLAEVGFIGVDPKTTTSYDTLSPGQLPGKVVSQVAVGLHAMASYPKKVGSIWDTVFEGKKRDPNGAVGIVGLGEIGGQIADAHQVSVIDRFAELIEILALVNLLLFFFNLLPLLPLDGGHVAGALYEAAKRGRARWLGPPRRLRAELKRDLESVEESADREVAKVESFYADTAQMLPVMYLVGSVIIVVSLLVMYADFVSPIRVN